MKQATRSFVTFRVGSQWYGIDIKQVIEISHLVMFSEVVTASPDILGMMTLRNIVMPVLDLRLRFGDTKPQYRLDTPIIAVRSEDTSLGLVVDEIDNVETLLPEMIATDTTNAFPYVSGSAQLPTRLLLILNLKALGVANSHPK